MARHRFALDGDPYTMTPTVPIRETAALDVLRALQVILVGADVTEAPNEKIAATLKWLERPYYSLRYVQKGLTHLERAGRIVRRWIEEETAWGIKKVRQITLTQTFFANAESRRKAKKAKDSGPKNFGPPRAPEGAVGARQGADPSFEGEQEKETRAGAADAGGGTPSSSPAGEAGDDWSGAPTSPEEAAAFLRAKIAEVTASKAVPPPPPREPAPRGPRRERPREVEREERPEEPPGDPIVRVEWEARRKALADATLDQLADLAALGNREARAELNRRHDAEVEAAKLAAMTHIDVDLASRPDRSVEYVLDAGGRPVVPDADQSSKAEAPPRGRDSPEVVPPQPAEKPRRGILGRLFGRG